MKKTTFSIPKMDCPSEEKIIRMALASETKAKYLKFDLQKRSLAVFHEGLSEEHILTKLEPLNFGAKIDKTENVSEIEENMLSLEKANEHGNQKAEARVLKILLVINLAMFVVEMIWGLIAQSMGLIADSMDMFADAAVYSVSLYAVGKALIYQKKAARFSGYLQMALALFALIEVIRRVFFGSEPEAEFMMGISLVALIANVACLMLISKHKEGGVHMKASMIFSANDVIANAGVILAGILVYFTKSSIPDLVIGAIISVIVFRGSISILKISKN